MKNITPIRISEIENLFKDTFPFEPISTLNALVMNFTDYTALTVQEMTDSAASKFLSLYTEKWECISADQRERIIEMNKYSMVYSDPCSENKIDLKPMLEFVRNHISAKEIGIMVDEMIFEYVYKKLEVNLCDEGLLKEKNSIQVIREVRDLFLNMAAIG